MALLVLLMHDTCPWLICYGAALVWYFVGRGEHSLVLACVIFTQTPPNDES